ncbi:hypothetical protein ACF08N_00795 [Streptomyces sp. NPDC015127]|uniref:hypothetical protein n=1 Tax=Streptomyces sp. NPDC015127 TaxID=3364939 RepID=UPI0036F63331
MTHRDGRLRETGAVRLAIFPPERHDVNFPSLRARVAGAAVLVSLTAACGRIPPAYPDPAPAVTEAEVIGVWKGDCGATFTVEEGGAAEITDFPVEYDRDSGVQKASGPAQWRLLKATKNIPQQLDLVRDQKAHTLSFGLQEGRMFLQLLLVDPADFSYDCDFRRV